MKRSEIAEVLKDGQAGQDIVVAGWIKSLRQSKNLAFLHLNDGSHFDNIQVIIDEALPNREQVLSLITGACLKVAGTLRESPAKGQRLEILPASIEILGACDDSSPIQKSRASFEFLRTIPHMRPRTNTFGAVFRMRSELAFAVHKFFNERGFVYTHTPIITTSDAEGAGEMFQVTTLDLAAPPRTEQGAVDFGQDFFGERANLTVSGQLEAEILALSLSKVYTFGPTFRAENANTTRHANEFWMIEPEEAFADLQDDMALAEDFVKAMIEHAFQRCERDLRFFDERIEKGLRSKLESIAKADFAVIEYREAIAILEKSGRKFEFPVAYGKDLQTEHERYLTEEYAQKPAFVINYPKSIKPFYMYCNEDDETVACFDLLVPRVGELIGGSQREHRLDVLEQRMRAAEMSLEDYRWYLDLRRFGSAPHAGFGLGFERAIMYLTGMANIRDVILCPRTPGNAGI